MSKKWFFLVCMSLGLMSVNAQFRKIPAEVTDSFKVRYENASGVSWKDKITSFQAEFTMKEREMKASFSSKGEWLKTETKYDYDHVPKDVKDGFKKSKYADLTVVETSKIDEKEKQPEYKVVVKKNDFNKKTLVFSDSGQLLSDNISF